MTEGVDFGFYQFIVVGVDNPRTRELLRNLHAPFNRSHEPFIAMDIRSAELTKYAANAMLAAKISFMNEIANIADRARADFEAVNDDQKLSLVSKIRDHFDGDRQGMRSCRHGRRAGDHDRVDGLAQP
jgi:UDP-glucose 6-dehydrogenase